MLIDLIIYFLIGTTLDAIATIDLIAVNRGHIWTSVFATIAGTFLGTFVFVCIFDSPDRGVTILSYALGSGLGAFIIQKKGILKKNLKKRELINE